MFCPKCGIQNPETGKFCRSCGVDLGNVNEALTGKLHRPVLDKKGKPVSYEGAISKSFSGFAFLAISLILAFSQMGRGWWFWLLIPAFAMIGSGVAQFVQLRSQQPNITFVPQADDKNVLTGSPAINSLSSSQTEYFSPESRYKTGDLVPASVVEGTTKLLEVDSEGKTRALPND